MISFPTLKKSELNGPAEKSKLIFTKPRPLNKKVGLSGQKNYAFTAFNPINDKNQREIISIKKDSPLTLLPRESSYYGFQSNLNENRIVTFKPTRKNSYINPYHGSYELNNQNFEIFDENPVYDFHYDVHDGKFGPTFNAEVGLIVIFKNQNRENWHFLLLL